MKILLLAILCIFSLNSFSQTKLYEENFNDILINDYGYFGGIAMGSTSTSKWDVVNNLSLGSWNSTGWFAVQNQRFESYKTGAPNSNRMIWKSKSINISGYSTTASVKIGHEFRNSNSGIEAFYSIDNGITWTSMGSFIANYSGGSDYNSKIVSKSNITGSTIIIKVEHWGTSSTPVYYHDDVLVTGIILCTQPTTQASATGLTVSNATKNSLNVNWKNGNGDKVIVIATPSGTAPVAPASGTAYTANSTYGTGQTTGSNNYVVYNGNGTNVDVTGLNPVTTYDFYVYSYNTTGNCYLTTSPYKFSATTLDVCNSPLAPVTFINFPSKTKTSIDVNWTNGSGDKVIVIARKSTDPAVKPTFSVSYNANSVFGSGQTTGIGNYVVYNGNGTNVSVTGLTESTSYYFDIYTYNSADNCYKGLITEGSNSKSTSTKSDYYNIKDLSGQTITTCEGKLVDGGGVSGSYSSGSTQTLIISPENNTDGSCLNFTQWELDYSSEITFYDGATKIYTAKNTWNQTNNDAPKFKGPGLVCASPGNQLKIEFKPKGTGLGFNADITCYTPPKPCNIEVSSVRSGICKGESLELIANGFVGASLLNNDFNSKTLGTDWSTLINPRFDNPCNPGLDGTYFWTSTDPKPRDLTSKGLDVSQGGSISFDFRIAAQAGTNELPGGSKDCEGSEKIEEGVFLEYSIDGTTWKPLHYFFPAPATDNTYFNETTNWQRYYFEIPKAAQTKNTKFRWIQYEIDNDINDVWGLDRINITAVSPFKIIWKDLTANQTIGTSNLNESPFKVNVSPTINTTYEAQIIDANTGKTLCSKQMTITVSDFDVNPIPESICGASDGKIEFSTTGTGVTYSINNGLSFDPNPVFSNLKGGTYDVVFKNPTCTATKKVTVKSGIGGPTVDDYPSVNQCVGTTFSTLTFKSTPIDPAVSYNWTNDNTNIGLAANGSTSIASFTLLNTTTTPLVSNIEVVPVKNGCVGEPKKFTITVKPKDNANFIATDYCEGSTGIVTISGVLGGTFTSNPIGLNVSGTTISNDTGGQNYDLTYTTPNCTNTYKQTVKVKAKQDATFDYNYFCEVQPNIAGGGATNILISGGKFESASAINGETIDPINGAITNGIAGNSYVLKYTPPLNSCYNATEKTIKIKKLENITLSIPDICSGSVGVAATVSPSGGEFDFTNPPASATVQINKTNGIISGGIAGEKYEVYYRSPGTLQDECQNTKIITVSVLQTPTINIQPIDDIQCEGKRARFYINASNALSYVWEEKSTAVGAVFTPITYGGVYQKGNGNKEDTLVITDNTGKENYEYRVTVGESASNSQCKVTSTIKKIGFTPKETTPTTGCDNTLRKIDQVGFDWGNVNTATKYDLKYEYTDPTNSTLKTGTFNDISVSNYTLNNLPKNTDVKLTVTPKGPNCYTTFDITCKTLDCEAAIINTPLADVTLCEDASSATFSVSAVPKNGTNSLNYKWFQSSDNGSSYIAISGTIFTNPTVSSLVITPNSSTKFKPYNNYKFKVEIEDNGCTISSIGNLKVNELPTFSPTVTSNCVNDPLYLQANFPTATKVVWSNSTGYTNTSSNDSKLQVIANATTNNNGNYNVEVTDGNGCKNSQNVNVTINPLPFVNAGLDKVICIGESVTLIGAGAINYSWDNGVSNNIPFKPTITNTYKLTGTDANGCKNTDEVVVTVNSLPTVSAGIDKTICIGEQITLLGSGALTYIWDNNVTDNTLFSPSSTLEYTVTGTDINGCKNTDVVKVTVNSLPVFSPTATSQCENDPLYVQANYSNATKVVWTSTTGYNYTSNSDSKLEVVTKATIANNGTYTVEVTDENGCINSNSVLVKINPLPQIDAGQDQTICIGTSTKLSAQGGVSYIWNNSVVNNSSFNPISTKKYIVIGTDANGCKNTDEVEINVVQLPIATPTANTPCEQDILNLDAGLNGAKTYNWIGPNGFTSNLEKPIINNVTLNAKGNYTLIVTDNNNCSNSFTLGVIVNPVDNIQFIDVNPTCKNGNVFNLPSVNIPGGTWSSDDNVSIQNPFVGTFDPSKSQPDQYYKVVVTYSTKTIVPKRLCPSTLSKVVFVYPTPDTSFMVNEKLLCITDTLIAEVLNPQPNTTYTWDFNNGQTFSGQKTNYVYPKSGVFDLTITAKLGICTNTSTRKQFIKVVDLPSNVEFTQSETEIDFYNPEVQFQTKTTANYYFWNFGDGSTSTYKNPKHKFPEIPGKYIVDLTVSNMIGKCGVIVSSSIFMPEPVIYFIPNTFTPNGDEINNTFQPVFTYGYDPQNYSFYIYNRWGNLIFESHDAKIGWDGTFGKELVQNDTYIWKLEFKEKIEEFKHVKTGHVNVLR